MDNFSQVDDQDVETNEPLHHDEAKPKPTIFDKTIMSPRKKIRKLEALKCWPEVKKMLLSGVKVSDICYYIQIEKEEYKEITQTSLATTIYRFIGKNKHMLLARPISHETMIASLELVDQLDAINLLFSINMDTVIKLHKKFTLDGGKGYDNFDKAMRSCNAVIQTLNDVRKDHVRYHIGKTSSTENDTMAQVERVKKIFQAKHGNRAAGILFNPESRRRVLNALQKVRNSDTSSVIDLLQRNQEKLKDFGDPGIDG